MDPITFLIIAFVVMEAADGGFLTANVAGGAAAGGRAAWREAKKGTKGKYASRAKRLKKTALGRWRLRTEGALASMVTGTRKGLAAGIRAVPEGARQGRAVRKQALAKGRQKLASAVQVRDGEWFTDGLPGGWRGRVQRRGPLAQIEGWRLNPETGEWEREVAGAWRPARDGDQDMLRQWVNGAQWDPPAEPAAAGEVAEPAAPTEPEPGLPATPGSSEPPADPTVTSPAPGGGKKEEPMTTGTANDMPTEDRGVKPYVDGWAGQVGVLERLVSQAEEIADMVAASVDANARHDPHGAADVVGALRSAVESLQAAGEQIQSHAGELNDKWASAIEHLQGTGADSAAELVGAS